MLNFGRIFGPMIFFFEKSSLMSCEKFSNKFGVLDRLVKLHQSTRQLKKRIVCESDANPLGRFYEQNFEILSHF